MKKSRFPKRHAPGTVISFFVIICVRRHGNHRRNLPGFHQRSHRGNRRKIRHGIHQSCRRQRSRGFRLCFLQRSRNCPGYRRSRCQRNLRRRNYHGYRRGIRRKILHGYPRNCRHRQIRLRWAVCDCCWVGEVEPVCEVCEVCEVCPRRSGNTAGWEFPCRASYSAGDSGCNAAGPRSPR